MTKYSIVCQSIVNFGKLELAHKFLYAFMPLYRNKVCCSVTNTSDQHLSMSMGARVTITRPLGAIRTRGKFAADQRSITGGATSGTYTPLCNGSMVGYRGSYNTSM